MFQINKQYPWEIYSDRNHRHPDKIPNLPPLYRKHAQEKVFTALSNIVENRRHRAIYVHIPFCSQICPFCPFFRKKIENFNIEVFVSGILSEIKFLSECLWNNGNPIEAIHIGGGTPTSLPMQHIVKIINHIKDSFPLSRNCEISVESRVTNIDSAYLKELLSVGVNRISFGVQSFDTEVRRNIGRIAPTCAVISVIKEALNVGFDTVCVDLMYPLPNQSLRIWESDINTMLQLGVNGTSIYRINRHEDTIFFNEKRNDSLYRKQDIKLEYEFFKYADMILCDTQNWKRVAGSYYARGKGSFKYIDLHYSTINDVLPIGPGASGQIGTLFFANGKNLTNYLSNGINEYGSMAWNSDDIYCEAWRYHDLSVKLFLHDLSKLKNRSHAVEKLIKDFIKKGLAKKCGKSVKLTEVGIFWSRNIYSEIQGILEDELKQRMKNKTM
jgi:oxygen-independent coproporphyrinogen-3 oxidase